PGWLVSHLATAGDAVHGSGTFQAQPQSTATFAVLEFKKLEGIGEVHRGELLFFNPARDSLERAGKLRLRKKKAPHRRRRAVRRRARLSYGRPAWAIYLRCPPSGSAGRRRLTGLAAPAVQIVLTAKVAFLVAGLDHLTVLDDHTEASVEVHLLQQALGGGGKQRRVLHLAAQLEEGFLVHSAEIGGQGGGIWRKGKRDRRGVGKRIFGHLGTSGNLSKLYLGRYHIAWRKTTSILFYFFLYSQIRTCIAQCYTAGDEIPHSPGTAAQGAAGADRGRHLDGAGAGPAGRLSAGAHLEFSEPKARTEPGGNGP